MLLDKTDEKIVEVTESLLRAFQDSKFRLESYFELCQTEDYGLQLENIQRELIMCFLDKIKIVRTPCLNIAIFTSSIAELLKKLLKRPVECNYEFSSIYCFLQMYSQFVAAFSSEKKSSSALSYGLPKRHYIPIPIKC